MCVCVGGGEMRGNKLCHPTAPGSNSEAAPPALSKKLRNVSRARLARLTRLTRLGFSPSFSHRLNPVEEGVSIVLYVCIKRALHVLALGVRCFCCAQKRARSVFVNRGCL